MGARRELNQIAPADLVLGQQHEVKEARRSLAPARAVAAVARRDIGLHTQQRLNPSTNAGLVELNRAIEIAVVSNRQRLLAQRPRPFGQRRNLREAVKLGVLGMGMQVREHSGLALRPSSLCMVALLGSDCRIGKRDFSSTR